MSEPETTALTVTDDQIRALRDEAASAGDESMVETCDDALARGWFAARARCAEVIADAEARQAPWDEAAVSEPTRHLWIKVELPIDVRVLAQALRALADAGVRGWLFSDLDVVQSSPPPAFCPLSQGQYDERGRLIGKHSADCRCHVDGLIR